MEKKAPPRPDPLVTRIAMQTKERIFNCLLLVGCVLVVTFLAMAADRMSHLAVYGHRYRTEPAEARRPELPPNREYPARTLRVIDGDTLEVYIDRGQGDYSIRFLRLLDIDTPETSEPAGAAATRFTVDWIVRAAGLHSEWPLRIKSDKRDSFGRWLGIVTDTAGRNLRDDLAAAGHVKPGVK